MSTQHISGSCHCGAVAYEVDVDLSKPITCNCSICGKTGAVMVFVPASAFTLLRGEDQLTDYQFGKKNIHHLFCTTCGVRSFGRGANPDGTPTVMINVRCLEGIDAHTLAPTPYDGKSL